MNLLARYDYQVEDEIRRVLIDMGVQPGTDVIARRIRAALVEKFSVPVPPEGAVSLLGRLYGYVADRQRPPAELLREVREALPVNPHPGGGSQMRARKCEVRGNDRCSFPASCTFEDRCLLRAARRRSFVLALSSFFAVLAIGLPLVCASNSEAAELRGPGAEWARSVIMRVPGPAGPEIVVSFERCPGMPDAGGCWNGDRSTIYARPRDEQTYLHELGHAFDERNLDDLERDVLKRELDFPWWTPWENAMRWSGDVFCERIACPNERLADVYAYCSLHPWHQWSPGRVWIEGWRPMRARFRELCWLIREYA